LKQLKVIKSTLLGKSVGGAENAGEENAGAMTDGEPSV